MPYLFDPYEEDVRALLVQELQDEDLLSSATEDEEEDDGDEDDEDEEDEEYNPILQTPRQSPERIPPSPFNHQNDNVIHEVSDDSAEEDDDNKRRRTAGGGDTCSSSLRNEWNRSDIEGLCCPICLDALTNDGGHHIWFNQSKPLPSLF